LFLFVFAESFFTASPTYPPPPAGNSCGSCPGRQSGGGAVLRHRGQISAQHRLFGRELRFADRSSALSGHYNSFASNLMPEITVIDRQTGDFSMHS
jgi:hypothetical protein